MSCPTRPFSRGTHLRISARIAGENGGCHWDGNQIPSGQCPFSSATARSASKSSTVIRRKLVSTTP